MKSGGWFKDGPAGGLLLFPISVAGWLVLICFVLAMLGAAWMPRNLAKPYLLICIVVYLTVSYWKKQD